jgi:hypothetical protein
VRINAVHVVTIPDHKVIANILVGAPARGGIFNGRRWAYVTSEIGGQVSKLDVAANKVVQVVPVDVKRQTQRRPAQS